MARINNINIPEHYTSDWYLLEQRERKRDLNRLYGWFADEFDEDSIAVNRYNSTDYNKVTEEEICKQYHQDYDAITPGKKKKKNKVPLEERVKAILNCNL